MEIKDKALFVSEVSELTRSKEYKEIIKALKKREATLRDEVFAIYFNPEPAVENQVYNEKNATVELMKLTIEVKDLFEALPYAGKKYIIEQCEETLEDGKNQIKKQMWGINTGLTMGVYTYSDLLVRQANSIEDAITFYDKKLEECKNDTKSESTLDEPKED